MFDTNTSVQWITILFAFGLLLIACLKLVPWLAKKTFIAIRLNKKRSIITAILVFFIILPVGTIVLALPALIIVWCYWLIWAPSKKQKELSKYVSSVPTFVSRPEAQVDCDSEEHIFSDWVLENWSQIAFNSNLTTADKDSTNQLREYERPDQSGDGLMGVLAYSSNLLGKRNFENQPNIYINGSSVYQIPLIHSRNFLPSGPSFLIDVLPGMTVEQYRKQADLIASNMRVKSVRISQNEWQLDNGRCELTAILSDPLAKAFEMVSVPAVEDLNKIPFAMTENGESEEISFKNVSGVLIGGVPGSGKTGSMSSLFAGLIQSPLVQPIVLDGKGGSDWEWITDRSSYYASDPSLEDVEAMLQRVENIRKARVATQKEERGHSNFWSLPLEEEHPVIMLVIDECQTYLESKSGLSKEDKDRANRIAAYIKKFVNKGRNAGIVVFLMTQKPTADSIPTGIRDNCGLSISFRVKTVDAAEAILGLGIRTSDLSPTNITKNQPGVAVMESDEGYSRVRVPYIEEQNAERIAMQHQSMRKTLEEIEGIYGTR